MSNFQNAAAGADPVSEFKGKGKAAAPEDDDMKDVPEVADDDDDDEEEEEEVRSISTGASHKHALRQKYAETKHIILTRCTSSTTTTMRRRRMTTSSNRASTSRT